MIRKLSHAGTITLLLTLVACAHGLALKTQVGTALKVNEEALTQARVTELALYTSKTIPALTPEKHLAFIDALLAAQHAEGLAIQAYIAWDASQPVPTIVLTYKSAASNVLAVMEALGSNPQAIEAVKAAQRLVDEATKLVELFKKGSL